MPRRSTGPVYYKSKQAWFANINKRSVKLVEGPENRRTAKLARDRYNKLAGVLAVEVEGDGSTVEALLNRYLTDCRERLEPLAPKTYQNHADCIAELVAFDGIGQLPYRKLTMAHINRWASAGKVARARTGPNGMKWESKWSDNFVVMRLKMLRAAFNRLVSLGLVSESPMARKGRKEKLPTDDANMKRLAITDAEHAAILAQARRRSKGDFAELVELLYHTGARPAEIHQAKASEWRPDLRAFVIDPADPANVGRLKNRAKLKRAGRKRVVRVPVHLVPVVEALIKAHPEGTLFRRETGEPWTRTEDIANRMRSLVRTTTKRRAKRKLDGVREGLTLYSYRHAYVTRWLTQGRSAVTLCELLDTSMAVLMKHYSHLFEKHDTLTAAVDDFGTPTAPSPQTAAPAVARVAS